MLIAGVLMALQPLHLFVHRANWGQDAHVLIRFVMQIAAESDSLWPGPWLSEAQGGLGSPAFSFYPPLLFFAAQTIRVVVSVDSHATALALARLAILLSGLGGATVVLYRMFGLRAASTAFLLFTLSPYLSFINVAVRYAAAESAGSGLMFLALTLVVAIARGWSIAAPLLALVSTLILLTHLPSFIMTAVLVGSFALFSRPSRVLLPATCAGLVAVTIAAFHFAPSLQLRDAISLDLFLDHGHSYRGTMLFWGMLALRQLSYNWYLLYATLALLLAVAAILLQRERQAIATAPVVRGLTAAFAASIFLATPLSIPLWEHLPVLPLMQFPWRFFGAASVAAAVLAAVLARPGRAAVAIALQATVLAACLASLIAFTATDRWPNRKPEIASGRAMDRAASGTSLLRDPPEYVPRAAQMAGWASMSVRDGRTVPVAREVVARDALPRLLEGEGRVSFERIGPARFTIAAACRTACVIELPQFWFPGWALAGGGAETVGPSEAGLVEMTMPAGETRLVLHMTDAPIKAVARRASMIGLVGLLLWFAAAMARHPTRRGPVGRWNGLGGHTATPDAAEPRTAAAYRH